MFENKFKWHHGTNMVVSFYYRCPSPIQEDFVSNLIRVIPSDGDANKLSFTVNLVMYSNLSMKFFVDVRIAGQTTSHDISQSIEPSKWTHVTLEYQKFMGSRGSQTSVYLDGN
jgi:hypothetical protein